MCLHGLQELALQCATQTSPVADDVLINHNFVLLEKCYAGAASKSKVAQLISLLVCLACLCCEQNASNLHVMHTALMLRYT